MAATVSVRRSASMSPAPRSPRTRRPLRPPTCTRARPSPPGMTGARHRLGDHPHGRRRDAGRRRDMDRLCRPPAARDQSTVEGDPMTATTSAPGRCGSERSHSRATAACTSPARTRAAPRSALVMARATSSADKCWMAAGPLPGNPNSTRVYIGYNQGLLRSDDLGNTWAGPVTMAAAWASSRASAQTARCTSPTGRSAARCT